MYCEKCKRIIDTEKCPVCKRSSVREPRADDLCLLTEQDYICSGILEDILKQADIPYLKKEVMGAGLSIKVGPMLDRSRFYVMYDLLEKAAAIVNGLFAEPEEEPEEETEEEPEEEPEE